MLQDSSVDIALISETWMTDNANHTTAVIRQHGYNIIHNFRVSSVGGGTAILFKDALNLGIVNLTTCSTFEYTAACIKCTHDMKIVIVCIYRTGPLSRKFYEELNCLLQDMSVRYDSVIVGGDLNIHVENDIGRELLDITTSYGLEQSVNSPTHNAGGTIDLLFSSFGIIKVSSVKVHTDCDFSDHYPITFHTHQFSMSVKVKEEITFRDFKGINMDMFTSDLVAAISSYSMDQNGNFESLVSEFNECMGSILNNHAPIKTKIISKVHTAPWFDNEYKEQRKLRRKAEERWSKSGLSSDRQLLRELTKETTLLAKLKKQKYYRDMVNNREGDMKAIFSVVNKELDRKKKPPLPVSDNVTELAKDFNNFFTEKIRKIRDNLDKSPYKSLYSTDSSAENDSANPNLEAVLDSFTPCTEEELRGIIKSSGVKCSPSDFLPTNILKEHIDDFIPVLCELVNVSLATGSMEGVKIADIIPTLKGTNLDPNDLKNYRPISNLTFLGKLVERVVLARLNEHMDQLNLHIPEQSAYKKNHSTETILVKVVNDLIIASDKSNATVLMLLDLSAAFDTVDHNTILRILEKEIKIRGTALKWFRSFLVGRCQRTRLGAVTSEEIVIMFGVPQGSVLGPVLFNIYIRSMYSTVKQLGFSIQGYADDHQIYKSFKSFQQNQVLTLSIKDCFRLIQKWMCSYSLQLNPTKTQIIVIGPQRILNEININGVNLTDDVCVRFVSSTKNLGVMIDDRLSFHSQVMSIKRDCFRLIRNINKVRFLLTPSQLKMIVNSIVICKLDYCNVLYYGISEKMLDELQRIQNAAGKAVYGLYKHDQVGDTLKKLHWLPIRQRIRYKILLLVYKALNGNAPDYLTEMFMYCSYSHKVQLDEPRVCTALGDRAFSKCGPMLWNKVPMDVKNAPSAECFKILLKTHLFQEAYPGSMNK